MRNIRIFFIQTLWFFQRQDLSHRSRAEIVLTGAKYTKVFK